MAERKKGKPAPPTCPKCGMEMDDRGDKVWVCTECGWTEPMSKK